jgi:2-polyprenyl-6-hydroxyphenyl methylase/3-demethylubiquinone-9 3-methyltransferase
MMPILNPRPIPCKVCTKESPLFGVVDFHKSCIEAQGKKLNLSGIPIFYRRCSVCGFLFTDAFDDWSNDAFLRNIYNGQYVQVDPDFAELRPTANAKMVASSFEAAKQSLRIVDYGGGNGLLAALLKKEGFAATTYDPFHADSSTLPAERFDLITCFEVMEHVAFPEKTLAQMAALLKEQGGMWVHATGISRCTRAIPWCACSKSRVCRQPHSRMRFILLSDRCPHLRPTSCGNSTFPVNQLQRCCA